MFRKYFQNMIKSFSIIFLFSFLNLNIITSFAQSQTALPDFKDIGGLISNFNGNILQNLVILFSGLAVALFLFGLVKFILHRSQGGKEANIKDDKKNMLWGLGALFVLVSLWGIINLAQDILDIDKNNNNIHIPKICINDNCEVAGSNQGSGGVVNFSATCPSGTKVASDGSCLPDIIRDTNCATGYIKDQNNQCVQDTSSQTPNQLSTKKSPGSICTVLSGGNSNTECTEGYYCKSSTQLTGSTGICSKLP